MTLTGISVFEGLQSGTSSIEFFIVDRKIELKLSIGKEIACLTLFGIENIDFNFLKDSSIL